MGHAVVVHLPVIPVFQQIPPQFPAMLNTRTHPRPDGLASVSAKNVEIPSEKHKTKSSAKVAGIDRYILLRTTAFTLLLSENIFPN